jgi:hypothetical protein
LRLRVPGAFAAVFFVSLCLSGLPGCSKSPDQKRMDGFIGQFADHSRSLKPGTTATFKIEGLAAGEQLIVANGSRGKVSAGDRLGASLIGEIEKQIKATDAGFTLLMLVREGRVLASDKLAADNLITNFVPVENNVKVAEGDREFYIECIGRPAPVDGKQPSGLWNSECYSVLAEMAL